MCQTCLQLILRSQHQPSLTPTSLIHPGLGCTLCFVSAYFCDCFICTCSSHSELCCCSPHSQNKAYYLIYIYIYFAIKTSKQIFVEFWTFETDFICGYSVTVSFGAKWMTSHGILTGTQVHWSLLLQWNLVSENSLDLECRREENLISWWCECSPPLNVWWPCRKRALMLSQIYGHLSPLGASVSQGMFHRAVAWTCSGVSGETR